MGWLGAVQSQDYAGAKWALGQRTRGATEAELDRLFDEGAILRTHVMRPTWHFVHPEDIRCMELAGQCRCWWTCWKLERSGPRPPPSADTAVDSSVESTPSARRAEIQRSPPRVTARK